jgi:hypothetical protein
MKAPLVLLGACLLAPAGPLRANPEVLSAVGRQFGDSVQANVLLLKGSATVAEPEQWTAYARDTFRPREILRIQVQRENNVWTAAAAGSGTRVLDRAPGRPFDSQRLRVRSADARRAAAKAAVQAQAVFAGIDYQLAANPETGAPEWGLALRDDTGYEVGFVVVSAETGAVSFQDWTPRVRTTARNPADAAEGGEQAAKTVKRAARRAWNWTDNARKETGNFFRELFR